MLLKRSASRFPNFAFISILFIALGILGTSKVSAGDNPEASIFPITEKIHIDGILAESIWKGPPSIHNFTQVEPHSGAAPTESTKVWFGSTKDALYIAVQCDDRNPGQIVSTEMRRDAFLIDNDNVELVLDTYHDHRNAYFFATNPSGALVDGRVSDNQSAGIEWGGIWNVRTHRDEKGWTAEFEIPFKTIGFNPNLSTWGFNISRNLPRKRELSRWASASQDTHIFQIINAGHIIGITNPSQGVGLDIKPFGIIGFTRDIERKNILLSSGQIGEDLLQGDYNGGADIFYRITSNLVSSTTINTDFAETEADARQVNLTRFQLFFPEKRSFFLEDAGVFDFAKAPSNGPPQENMGGDILPFFSRRIGLADGYEIPLRIGEKLTGKIGRFEIGMLDVQTGSFKEPDRIDAPGFRFASKNLAVGRMKVNFLSQSYIGAIFTNGDPTGQTSNQLGGIDFKLATSNFLNKGKNLSVMLFGSKTKTTDIQNRDTAYGGVLSFPNDLLSFEYKWMNIGQNYNPALGFVPRRGVRISSFNVELSPRPKFRDVRQLNFEVSYKDYFSTEYGAWQTKELVVTPFQFNLNSGDFFGYDWSRSQEQLFEPWLINWNKGIAIPTGEYKFDTHIFKFFSSQSRPVGLMTDFSFGDFYSGTRTRYFGELSWRKNSHLSTAFTLEQNWVHLAEGDFDSSLLMYRLDYSFTPLISLTNFVQYDTDSRNIGLQSRLRWILKPGNEFFVVLNHSWQENNLNRFEAVQTRFRIKLNYVFRL